MEKDSLFKSIIEAYNNIVRNRKSRHLERQCDVDEKLMQIEKFADLTSPNLKKSVLDKIREWYPSPGR